MSPSWLLQMYILTISCQICHHLKRVNKENIDNFINYNYLFKQCPSLKIIVLINDSLIKKYQGTFLRKISREAFYVKQRHPVSALCLKLTFFYQPLMKSGYNPDIYEFSSWEFK